MPLAGGLLIKVLNLPFVMLSVPLTSKGVRILFPGKRWGIDEKWSLETE